MKHRREIVFAKTEKVGVVDVRKLIEGLPDNATIRVVLLSWDGPHVFEMEVTIDTLATETDDESGELVLKVWQ